MIRVLLADDQALLRGTFRMLFDATDDMETVGEASDGREAVELAGARHPDVVLMDIRMPEMDGIEATRRITASEDLTGVKVLVLTTFEDDEHVAEALRGGASGFLGKGARPEELLDAVRTVAGGEALLSPTATRALITRFLAQPDPCPGSVHERLECLTPRERDVTGLVALGLSNDEIAERLFVSPLTAKTHVNRAMTKLAARDRAQLVVIAYQCGLVSPASREEPSRDAGVSAGTGCRGPFRR
ncbi:response regulator transcription factor [Streptomyces sp. TG1A-8]|uniref:response regulator transcription factor n=1 Tax=Streptomyces sp. TG1A-8 TaxID=3051385 RepID=UPI00265C6DFB|nr:response regulator transcription factor [Streptomyces sp. TG1A-8]MDO0924588.1 response regulator transcription factor [Streptomyces sp. TG1A-8]